MFVTRVLRGPPDVGMAYRHIRGTLRPARIRLESLTRLSHTRFANPRRQNFSFPLFRETERNFRISEFHGSEQGGARNTLRQSTRVREKEISSLRASFGGLRMSGWRIGTFVAPSAPQGSGWNRSLACRTHVSPTRDVKISVFHFSGKLNEISEFQNFRISWVGAGRGAKQPEHSSAREGNVRYARPSGASGCRDGVSAHVAPSAPRGSGFACRTHVSPTRDAYYRQICAFSFLHGLSAQGLLCVLIGAFSFLHGIPAKSWCFRQIFGVNVVFWCLIGA